MNLTKLETEQRNPNSMHIDQMTTIDMVKVINAEDKKVADAIHHVLPSIAKAIDLAAEKFNEGGRLIYLGAGTSGRLGALDAIELTPTYSVPPDRAFGLLAGGSKAMFTAVEGAEDSKEFAINDLQKVDLNAKDIVISLAASGRTPYAVSAIEYANKIGALTISVTCTNNNEMSKIAQVSISPIVGPEVITGSTRMKAATAQKMVLNMLSSGIMIKTGKVFQNLMINVQPTNIKLVQRSIGIISDATGLTREQSEQLFNEAGHVVNVAIVMHRHHLDKSQATDYLIKNNNRIA